MTTVEQPRELEKLLIPEKRYPGWASDVKKVWRYGAKPSMPIKHLERTEVAIVLGSADMLPAEQAALLYREGLCKYILCTGKGGQHLGGQGEITEARRLMQRAMQHGVPKEAFILEETATNTGANAQASHNLLDKKGILVSNPIIVHMPFSLGRDRGTLLKQWSSHEGHPQPAFQFTSLNVEIFEYLTRGFANSTDQGQVGLTANKILGGMLGDFQRMHETAKAQYGNGGYVVPVEDPRHYGQPTPSAELKAYERLVAVRTGYELERDENGNLKMFVPMMEDENHVPISIRKVTEPISIRQVA
jgi:hypothetical protein